MEIIVLIDNVVYGSDLKGEHGLSFLVKTGQEKILFDTGQSGLFVENSKYLNEELSDVDYVVLSHGHYDHTGGLKEFLKYNKKAKILMKKEALDTKYSDSKGSIREIGFKLKQHSSYPNEFVFLNKNYDITENIKVITNIDDYTDFESDEKHLFIRKNNEYIIDPFEDELFLLLKNNEKICVITGCAHKGIINILKTAVSISNNKNINLFIGGSHLKEKSQMRFDNTIEALKGMNIDKIAVNHCTGIDGYMKLKENIGEKVEYAFTGKKIKL